MLVLIGCAVITYLIRLFPHLVNGKIEETNYMRELPYVIITLLVMYCLKDIKQNNLIIPSIIGVLTVTGIHLLFKRTIVSIIIGTAVYMLCINVI